jgi:hypothetical protein
MEIRLVQGDLLFSQGDNPDKYIPIVRTADARQGTPVFLNITYFLHWPEGVEDERRREKLVDAIFRVRQKPPRGRPPSRTLSAD